MLAFLLAKACSTIDKILSQPVAVIDCPVQFSHITQQDVQSYSDPQMLLIPCSQVLPEKLSHIPHIL